MGGTTTANVGAYPVPLGQPLRRQFPTMAPPKRRKKRRRLSELSAEMREVLDLL